MNRFGSEELAAYSEVPEAGEKILNDFNQSTLDPVGPVGGEQGMRVLSEMNSFADHHAAFVKSLAPGVNVL